MGNRSPHVNNVEVRRAIQRISAEAITDHGALSGLADDDHPQYHDDTRAAAWLAAGHETTYDHTEFLTVETDPVFAASDAAGISATDIGNWDAAYGWGDHAWLYDATGTASGLVDAHELAYDHTLIASIDTLLTSGTTGQTLYADGTGYPSWTSKLLHDGTHFTLASGSALKSTGSLMLIPAASQPVQCLTGGNTRGAYSLDLQLYISAVTQVASGNYCACVGVQNTASANSCYCIGGLNVLSSQYGSAIGVQNSLTADSCSAIGRSNSVSGQYGVAIGYHNTISGIGAAAAAYYCTCSGGLSGAVGYQALANLYGQQAHAAGQVTALGDCQLSRLIARRRTTNATQSTLYLNGSSELMVIPENTAWGFRIAIVGRQTNDDFSVARYVVEGVIARDTGGNATLVDQSEIYAYESDATWAYAIDADAASQCLRIQVTGAADNNISWVARVELEQITG